MPPEPPDRPTRSTATTVLASGLALTGTLATMGLAASAHGFFDLATIAFAATAVTAMLVVFLRR